jgi:hypothetical protein
MDALELLTRQHRELDELFDEFERTGEGAKRTREQLCGRIADVLAVHSTIEEKIFYPATKHARTRELLREAVEEHLASKRLLSDLLDTNIGEEHFGARMKALRERIGHHVEEEEKDLFPEVKKLLDAKRLEELGEEMEQMADELREGGEPRLSVQDEADRSAPI